MTLKKLYIAVFATTVLTLGCAGTEGAEPHDREASPQEQDSMEAASASAVFSGTVRNDQGVAQVGAEVIINGISRTTDATGRYFMSVATSPNGYNISIKKTGFAPLSEFYALGRTSLIHSLKSGHVVSINPTVDNTVTTPSGVSVVLKANSLAAASGPPVGTVQVTIAAYDPLRMPGDFTAVNSTGQQVALESVGAVFIGAMDSNGQSLNLKAGATAEGFIPVPSSVGNMPPCVFDGSCRIAMWKFNESTGKWDEKSAANIQISATGTRFTMQGSTSLAPQAIPVSTGGLGMWNADIEKTAPACSIIEFVGFPSECFGSSGGVQLNLKLPNSAGTLISRTDTMTPLTSFTVLYNIRANVVQEVGVTFPAGAPAICAKNLEISSSPAPVGGFPVYSQTGGITRFNGGAPWGGTGFPRDTGGALIDFEDVALNQHPCKSHVWFQTSL
jgi:hypothetical protein